MDDDHHYYNSLFDQLREGVANNKFMIPSTEFHNAEASYSGKVDESLWYIVKRLSRDFSFNFSNSIQQNQLLIAACEFAGLKLPELPWWTTPFSMDPDTPGRDLPDSEVKVHLKIETWAQHQKGIRDDSQINDYRTFKSSRVSIGASYDEEVEYGRGQLVREGYYGVLALMERPEFVNSDWALLHYVSALDIVNFYRKLDSICSSRGGIDAFVESPEFLTVPFFDIYARLRAADIVQFPDRTPEPSLLDDFTIVATVLPYVHYLATENYMAELIKQTKIGDKYNCGVFTMRQKVRFMDLLKTLPSL